MASPLDVLMDAFTKFTADGDLGVEEGVRLFLAELFGPSKLIRVGEDADGQMVVTVSEDDPPEDVDMDEEVEEGLRAMGIDPALVRIAARSGSADEYQAMKARLGGRRK